MGRLLAALTCTSVTVFYLWLISLLLTGCAAQAARTAEIEARHASPRCKSEPGMGQNMTHVLDWAKYCWGGHAGVNTDVNARGEAEYQMQVSFGRKCNYPNGAPSPRPCLTTIYYYFDHTGKMTYMQRRPGL